MRGVTTPGTAGGATTRRFTRPCSLSRTTPASPLELQGGTTFTFVTDGVEAALEQARATAGDRDVLIAGGASVVGQCLDAGGIDEFTVSIAPLLLGGGTPLFAGRSQTERLEQIGVIQAPGVAHVTYRIGR